MVKRKEKGVTLVEVVVAMALIAIVSATIFVTANFSINSQAKNKRNQFFINETENVLMCYYNSETLENFENALRFLTDDNELELDDELQKFTLYYTQEFAYTTAEESVYCLEIDYSGEFELSPKVTCKTSGDKTFYVFGGENA